MRLKYFPLILLLVIATLPLQSGFATDAGGSNCVEGQRPGCDGVCGSDKVFDDCGVCDGNNEDKDDCGVCFGDDSDKGCDGVCFSNTAVDSCGVCDGTGPGVCGCNLTSVPDACGVCDGNGAGPCGCDLSIQKDNCGVCGGDGSSCAPNCTHFLVHNRADYNAFYSGANVGQPIFSGEGSDLGCLQNALSACGSSGIRNRYDFSDDCVAGYLYSSGTYVNTSVTSCYLIGCDYGLGQGQTQWVMNSNCQRVDASPSQLCNLYMDWVVSPISLLWEDAGSIEDYTSLSKFPLEIADASNWYVWRASGSTPLLVWDPEHNGEIKSAEQLFGNWTFGGKHSAFKRTSLGAGNTYTPGNPWNDGYEALGSLDEDRNGSIDGTELEPLALWFDRNADGISDKGEVISVKKAGVTALYYEGAVKDERTGDVHLNMGYTRTESGETVSGSSVDWYAKGYSSYAQAVQEIMHRNNFGVETAPDRQVIEQPSSEIAKPASLRTEDPVFGTWQWKISERPDWVAPEIKTETSGLLFFTDSQKNEFLGRSYFEVPFVGDSTKILKSTIIGLEFKGWKLIDENLAYYYRFTIVDKRGNKTTSNMYIDESGDKATAKTTFVSAKTGKPFSYTWEAEKILPRMEKLPSFLENQKQEKK